MSIYSIFIWIQCEYLSAVVVLGIPFTPIPYSYYSFDGRHFIDTKSVCVYSIAVHIENTRIWPFNKLQTFPNGHFLNVCARLFVFEVGHIRLWRTVYGIPIFFNFSSVFLPFSFISPYVYRMVTAKKVPKTRNCPATRNKNRSLAHIKRARENK